MTVPTIARFDYGARTDGNPEYIGMARAGTPDDSLTWKLYKLTWESTPAGVSRPTKIEWVDFAAWVNRAEWFV